MSETQTADPGAGSELHEAAVTYAMACAKLPPPGEQFHGPEDAVNFRAAHDAWLRLERVCLSVAGVTR